MSSANPNPDVTPSTKSSKPGIFSGPSGGSPQYTAGDVQNPENAAAVKQLNSFLRGEISAAETYRMAIDKVSGSEHASAVGLISDIQEEHGRAAQSLRNRIRELGGEAADSSGAWGTWAKVVTGVANIFGDAASLKALKEGEEHGLKDYQEGLDDIDATSADLVQNQLIPAQQKHIGLLNGLIDQVNRS